MERKAASQGVSRPFSVPQLSIKKPFPVQCPVSSSSTLPSEKEEKGSQSGLIGPCAISGGTDIHWLNSDRRRGQLGIWKPDVSMGTVLLLAQLGRRTERPPRWVQSKFNEEQWNRVDG